MSVSVCVCHISGTTCPDFTKFSVLVARVRGSVLTWRRSDMLFISGFVDDRLFSYNGPYGSMPIPLQRRPCSVLCRIAPGPSCFISIFIYYKQQMANRPLTCCNIQQCIHDTVFELGLCKISFAIF